MDICKAIFSSFPFMSCVLSQSINPMPCSDQSKSIFRWTYYVFIPAEILGKICIKISAENDTGTTNCTDLNRGILTIGLILP